MVICFLNLIRLSDSCGGGVETVSRILVRQFLQDGHKVVLCSFQEKVLEPSIGFEGCIQYDLSRLDILGEGNIQTFQRILAVEKVDFVLNETYLSDCQSLCIAVKKVYPFYLCYTLHQDPYTPIKRLRDNCAWKRRYGDIRGFFYSVLKYPFSALIRYKHLKKQLKFYVEGVDAFVLLSEKFRNQVDFILDYQYHNLFVITNPIELTPITYKKKNENQVVFVGRLDQQKRVDRMLDIWRLVEQERPESSLVLVGDGNERIWLDEYAKKIGLKNYRFVGTVSARPFIAESTILCMVSSYEGLPMTVLEAQSLGTIPIVYESCGAVDDVITSGEDGWIVKSFSKNLFAKTIILTLEDQLLRTKLSKNAISSSAKHSASIIAKEWYDLFEQLKKEK